MASGQQAAGLCTVAAGPHSRLSFREGLRQVPREAFNRYFFTCMFIMGIGGITKGYDEGGFSGSVNLPSFRNDFKLNKSDWPGRETALTTRLSWIKSLGVFGAAIGATISCLFLARMTRIRGYRLYSLVWAVGIFFQLFASGNTGVLLFSRILSGLGAGALTVIGPVYLAEIAPPVIRGLLVSMYIIILLASLSLGFFINYIVQNHMAPTSAQYRIVQAIPLIPVGLSVIGTYWVRDSPRNMASRGLVQECQEELCRLRNLSPDHPYLLAELKNILRHTESELEAIRAHSNGKGTVPLVRQLHDIFISPTMRSRLLLILLFQVVSQWSGGNAITYFIPTIFKYAGLKGSSEQLISSGAYGLTKLFSTIFFAFFLVDIVGRRACFISGLILQLSAHIYLAIYSGSLSKHDYVNPNVTNAAIAAVFVYAVGWSIGLCTLPYLYGPEMFPTHVRQTYCAISMGVHWLFQFAVVQAGEPMFETFHVWGGFCFYASICFVGLIALILLAPETKGLSLEEIEDMLHNPDKPWSSMTWIGMKLAKRAAARDDEASSTGHPDKKV